MRARESRTERGTECGTQRGTSGPTEVATVGRSESWNVALRLAARDCENDPRIQLFEELRPPLSRVSPTIGLGRIGWGIGLGAGFSATDAILGLAPQIEDRPLLLIGARALRPRRTLSTLPDRSLSESSPRWISFRPNHSDTWPARRAK
jgi:hypothetical protein